MTFRDDEGAELWFAPCADGGAMDVCVKTADKNEVSFRLHLLDFPDVIRVMHEKAGRSAPVMLGRPEIDWCASATRVGPFLAARDGEGRVVFMPAGAGMPWHGAWKLDPAAARQFAAVLVAYADAEPDPADVDELAEILAADRGRPGNPHELDVHLARVILRDGRFGRREAGRG